MTDDRTITTIRDDLTIAISEVRTRYPNARSAIMPALYLAQDKYATLDGLVYQAIAEILDIPEIYVFEVASFYTLYHREAVGRFHLQLCTNVSCMLLGAYDLLGHLEQRLGIRAGAMTDDGRFSIRAVECIGACDHAPVMMVNEDYHNDLTRERVDALLDGLEEIDTLLDDLEEKISEGVS